MSILHTGQNVDLHFAQLRDLVQRVVLLEGGTGTGGGGTGTGGGGTDTGGGGTDTGGGGTDTGGGGTDTGGGGTDTGGGGTDTGGGTGGVGDGTSGYDLQNATIVYQSTHFANMGADKLFTNFAEPFQNTAWRTDATNPTFTMDTGVPITVEVVKFYGTMTLPGGPSSQYTEGNKWPKTYSIYPGQSADGPFDTLGYTFTYYGDYPPTTPQTFTCPFPNGAKTSRYWKIEVSGGAEGHRVNQAVFFGPAA